MRVIFLLALVAPTLWSDWTRSRELIPSPDAVDAPYAWVGLDEDIWRNAQPSLADLRLVNAAGEEVPYLVQVLRDQVRHEERQARLFNVGLIGPGTTQATLDFGRPTRTTELTLETPTRDFRGRVSVEGSNHQREWLLLRERGVIYDEPGPPPARSTRVSYPEAEFRYLRLTVSIQHPPDKEVVIRAVTTAFELRDPGALHEVRALAKESGRDPEQRSSFVRLDLGEHPPPYHSIRLSIKDERFARDVTIQASDDGTTWFTVHRSEVSRIRRGDRVLEQTRFEIREGRWQHLRLVFADQDNPPLRVSRVALAGWQRRLVLPYQAREQYRILYGNRAARAPAYDFGRIFAREQVAPDEIAQMTLAAPQAILAARQAEETKSPVGSPYILVVALILAGAVIAAAVFRATRSMWSSQTEEDRTGDQS